MILELGGFARWHRSFSLPGNIFDDGMMPG
jgi:hypothetical protein